MRRLLVSLLSCSLTLAGGGVVAADTSGGEILWTQRFGLVSAQVRSHDAPTVVSPVGSIVFVLGGHVRHEFAISAFAADDGTPVWTRVYRGPSGDGNGRPTDLMISPEGSVVFVTGLSRGRFDAEAVTIAFQATTGRRLWVDRYDPPRRDVAFAMAIASDGRTLFLAGVSWRRGTGKDALVIAYRAATGRRLWARQLDGPGVSVSADVLRDVAVMPSGDIVVAVGTTSTGRGKDDVLVFALRADTGRKRWSAAYDGPAGRNDQGTSIGVQPDGTVIYVAGSATSTTQRDMLTLALTPGGAQAWVRLEDGPATTASADEVSDLAVMPDGSGVVVAGASTSTGGDLDLATVSYEPNGDGAWAVMADGLDGSEDWANAVAVSSDAERVYVSGRSIADDPTMSDFLTVAYDAAGGSTVWADRWNGMWDDAAYDVAVSPDGTRVFVSGGAVWIGGGGHPVERATTLAYRA